jgi:hypothetical protein
MAEGMAGYWTELWDDWLRTVSQDCIKTLSRLQNVYFVGCAFKFDLDKQEILKSLQPLS